MEKEDVMITLENNQLVRYRKGANRNISVNKSLFLEFFDCRK